MPAKIGFYGGQVSRLMISSVFDFVELTIILVVVLGNACLFVVLLIW